jgi:hypothetical protein
LFIINIFYHFNAKLKIKWCQGTYEVFLVNNLGAAVIVVEGMYYRCRPAFE